MWFFRSKPQNKFFFAAMAGIIGLAGCGNSCVVGVVKNGNGSVAVAAGNPPPSCSLTPIPAVVNAIVVNAPTCEQCPAGTPIKNAFVTVRGIQLRSNGWNGTDSEQWVEIAPQLANNPRQIDLIDNSVQELVAENAMVPAGVYSEVKLQFLGKSSAMADELLSENACGRALSNCMRMADGHVEPLRLPGDAPEMFIRIQNVEVNSTVFLPGSRMELRLTLQPSQVLTSSGTEGLKLQRVLAGRAVVARRAEINDVSDANY
jgi:hypothetical protein